MTTIPLAPSHLCRWRSSPSLPDHHLHPSPTPYDSHPPPLPVYHAATNPIPGQIRHFLHHPTTLTPRPLRFSRTRYLRHWTIHRAWSLFTSSLRTSRERELERQYNSMAAANESLRLIGDGGRLFRKGMSKSGTWGVGDGGVLGVRSGPGMDAFREVGKRKGGERRTRGGVPMEYARGGGLVEWMGSTGGIGGSSEAKIWDGGWRRG
jgi:hypothetical protein